MATFWSQTTFLGSIPLLDKPTCQLEARWPTHLAHSARSIVGPKQQIGASPAQHGSTQHEPTGIGQTSKTSRAPLPPRQKQTRAARKCRSAPMSWLSPSAVLSKNSKFTRMKPVWELSAELERKNIADHLPLFWHLFWWLHWNRTPYFSWLNHCQTSVKPLYFHSSTDIRPHLNPYLSFKPSIFSAKSLIFHGKKTWLKLC